MISKYRRRLMLAAASNGRGEQISYIECHGAGIVTDIHSTTATTIIGSYYISPFALGAHFLFSVAGNMYTQYGKTSSGYYRYYTVRNTFLTQRIVETYNTSSAYGSGCYIAIKVVSSASSGKGFLSKESLSAPVSVDDTGLTVKITSTSKDYRVFESSAVLKMFANNEGTSISGDGDRFYQMKIFEGDTLAHNLVPWKHGDTYGIYDLITDTFYSEIIGDGTITGA